MLIKIANPKLENGTIEVDTDKLPTNVHDRLVEMALTSYFRSNINSAYANELNRAKKDHDAEQAKLAEEAKAAKKKYTPVEYDESTFTSALDPAEVAQEKLDAIYAGKIASARGKSGENKALIAMVTANVIGALKAKGKSHKEAVALVDGDPFAFIDKSARKRAGDDDAQFKAEVAKLNALYVDPARAILGLNSNSPAEEGEEADDLI